GNAKGDLFSSWLNPISILIGVLAVVVSAYLAAVYLCADAVRRGKPELVAPYRRRALVAGALAGLLAAVGIVVLHQDAHELYRGLVTGDGLPALIVSVLAGIATGVLVLRDRFEPARYTAALAVAAVVVGWALAQQPRFLPGLTIERAAAPHDTLVTVIAAVVGGAIILFPSLTLLLRLSIGGRLEHDEHPAVAAAPEPSGGRLLPARPALAGRAAAACLVVGVGTLTVAEAGWAHAVGVVALLAFVVVGFLGTVPTLLEGQDEV
ncbi:MAG: Cytochrome bd-type quinol oxidase subunit 2-like protein, partial [Solirubrobacterales bacterium]|nr:Cytochrome bd-type quinol oxidase subunit 2-like protein [Solirubrobacterales bacterium]